MNILITGASRGIGYEVVKQFAINPSNNIIVLSRNKQQLNQLKDYCKNQFQNHIHIYSIDFLAESFEQDLEKVFLNHQHHFDIIINNAGYLLNKPFADYSIKEVKDIYQVNTYAPIQIIQSAIKFNDKSKTCHIINISSMGGFQGSVKFPGLSIYSSSKAALANLTECLAEEYKNTNIKINCLALGSVQTEMLNQAFPDYKAQLTPQQIAKYIADFSVDGTQYFNGKIIPVSNTTP
jgi:short-subunit dehydrogenase